MEQLPKRFADFYDRLVESWNRHQQDWTRFSEYEQETIALKQFNRDYGGNGLIDYVEWNRGDGLEFALRGLQHIGCDRLAAILERCFALLKSYNFDFDRDHASEFVDALPSDAQSEWYQLEKEAASRYSDFYARWEGYFGCMTGGGN